MIMTSSQIKVPESIESIVDDQYLKRKQSLAARVAENRAEHIRSRQELRIYQKMEKTGEKPLEDPQVQADVLRIEADLKSESELQIKIINRLEELKIIILELERKVKAKSEIIQKQKFGNVEIDSQAIKLQIKQNITKLIQDIKKKEAKLLNLKHETENHKKQMESKTRQKTLLSVVTKWQRGEVLAETADSTLISAFQLYSNAAESWREARFAFDRKIMPDYFVHCWRALKEAINCYNTLISRKIMTNEDLKSNDLHDQIDFLFKNKIVVSTKLLDSLQAITDRIDRGVAVTPNPRYKDDIYEFLTKNMRSLKIG